MLKKVIHIFFIITGGTLGFLYMPVLVRLMNLEHMQWLMSSYVDSIIGAIIFFLLSYLFANHIVNFLKWIEDGLIKIPVVDLFFGSIGLILGLLIVYLINLLLVDLFYILICLILTLLIDYLINLQLTDIGFEFFPQIFYLFFTVIIGYLGFQVGFHRRDEFMGIITRNRKDKFKVNV